MTKRFVQVYQERVAIEFETKLNGLKNIIATKARQDDEDREDVSELKQRLQESEEDRRKIAALVLRMRDKLLKVVRAQSSLKQDLNLTFAELTGQFEEMRQ